MRIESRLTDGAALAELGRRIAQRRLERGLSQQQLADEAGISRHTLLRMERGDGVTLTAFMRVLRVLGLFEGLEQLVPETPPSPLELLGQERGRRRRARGRRASAVAAAEDAERPRPAAGADGGQSDWPWGTR